MIRAKIAGPKAWCGRPGCTHPYSLATIQAATDGSAYARLTGNRWRPDGHLDGMERYTTVTRTGRRISTTRTGEMKRSWGRGMRPECPIVVDCPKCRTVQVIP